MWEFFGIFGAAKGLSLGVNWTRDLYKELKRTRKDRGTELAELAQILGGHPLELAQYYVEPNCQHTNPADRDEEEPWDTVPAPVRKFLNRRWCHSGRGFKEQDGRQVLFILADAGMGKTALLVMLKLSHLTRFWPRDLDFRLIKIGAETLEQIGEVEERHSTVLLLDALDEDGEALHNFGARVRSLLQAVRGFRHVVITCRTQFFPADEVDEERHRVNLGGFTCPFLYLSLFDEAQTDAFLKKRYPAHWLPLHPHRSSLQRAKGVVEKMSSLKMRPMLLSRIDDLLEAEAKTDGVPEGSYRIYERLVDVWLLREERKDHATATAKELRATCGELAEYLQATDAVALSERELVTFLDDRAAQVKALDIGGRSLLNRQGGGAYRFAHRSIQEFLVAERLANGKCERAIRVTDQMGEFLQAWIEEDPERNGFALAWKKIRSIPTSLVATVGQIDPKLALRALVKAKQVTDEQVYAIFHGLTKEAGDELSLKGWKERGTAYRKIPELLDDPEAALSFLDRLRQRVSNGNDLFFLELAMVEVGQRWSEPEVAREVETRRSQIFAHLASPEDFAAIDTPVAAMWCEIPVGAFQMGSRPGGEDSFGDERPQHEVRITSAFEMASVPVTNAQYQLFDPTHELQPWDGVAPDELASHPVVNVTWYAAVMFCRWLAQAYPGVRLATEPEWEYACRAGTTTRFWSGNEEADLSRVGWYTANSGDRTHRVGELPANKWGLHDVHGNVWEWTQEPWSSNYSEHKSGRVVDPSTTLAASPAYLAGDAAATPGGRRVIRGGSYEYNASRVRSAYRVNGLPRFRYLGLRVPARPFGLSPRALTLDPLIIESS